MSGLFCAPFETEEGAREHLEMQRWPDGVVCPHCGVIGNAGKLEKKVDGNRNGKVVGFSAHARRGTWKCYDCREQFTVTVGTIFENSKVPLHKWLLAIHWMCSSPEGISALQMQRRLELGSYRSAWFLACRVRWAMTQSPMIQLRIPLAFDTAIAGLLKVNPHPMLERPATKKSAPKRTRKKRG